METKQSADFSELYEEFYKTITAQPYAPYIMHNEELAKEYAAKLKMMEDKAFIICVKDGPQYLTITDEARLEVAAILNADALHAASQALMYEQAATMAARDDETPDRFRDYLNAMAAAVEIDRKHATNEMETRVANGKMEMVLRIRDYYDNMKTEG